MKSSIAMLGRPVLVVLLACGLVACASAGKKNAPPDYASLMRNAEAEVSAGRVEPALVAFNEAAKADPTRKDAWVRTAQVHLNAGNYGRAIVAAEEVLKRDPTDLVADSVLTVAGLHVAAQSLQRLRNNGSLDSNPAARQGAERLAEAMRSTLGDEILLPEGTRLVRAGARGARPAQPAAPRNNPPPKPEKSADPFGVLGGN